jgi:hypothetical protein
MRLLFSPQIQRSNTFVPGASMATALATHSNEGKIQRGLEHLGCAARNFVMIANTVGLTRFMEGLNGVPGRHFSDAAAERMLQILGEMYELQIDLDAVNGTHIPINFGKVDAITTALTIRRVAKIMAEETTTRWIRKRFAQPRA